MLFSKENRLKVKEENPEMTFGQIGKKLGEMWRALTDKEKQDFKDRKG
jgi:HMG (high mobility group) box